MADTNYPPYAGLTFGADNNLATNASEEWSEWKTYKVSENLQYFSFLFKLSEILPSGTKLYSSIEFQIKDFVKKTDTSTISFTGNNGNADNTIRTDYKWYKNDAFMSGDGYYHFEGESMTNREGSVAKFVCILESVGCSIRYRRFRLVKMLG